MEQLKAIVKSKPRIHTVYFNEAGEWVFFPRPGFDRKLSREEILSSKSIDDVATDNPGAPSQAADGLLKTAQDAEDFETEKLIFEEEKAAFVQERNEFAANKAQRDAVDAELNKAKSDLKKAQKDLETAKGELKALKTKSEATEKTVKDEDDITK